MSFPEATVEEWFERELKTLDPTDEEASTLRTEFKNRGRGWTVRLYREHMDDRIRELRLGF